ncbi:MAG TPA: hypothetical protein VIX13_03260 [Candidatus Eisenbacteria bacterium]
MRAIETAPSPTPIAIARFAARLGTSRSHSVNAGNPFQMNSPIETRPIIMRTAVTRRSVASTFRARKARNAAEAMKKASRANIVDASGEFTML